MKLNLLAVVKIFYFCAVTLTVICFDVGNTDNVGNTQHAFAFLINSEIWLHSHLLAWSFVSSHVLPVTARASDSANWQTLCRVTNFCIVLYCISAAVALMHYRRCSLQCLCVEVLCVGGNRYSLGSCLWSSVLAPSSSQTNELVIFSLSLHLLMLLSSINQSINQSFICIRQDRQERIKTLNRPSNTHNQSFTRKKNSSRLVWRSYHQYFYCSTPDRAVCS